MFKLGEEVGVRGVDPKTDSWAITERPACNGIIRSAAFPMPEEIKGLLRDESPYYLVEVLDYPPPMGNPYYTIPQCCLVKLIRDPKSETTETEIAFKNPIKGVTYV